MEKKQEQKILKKRIRVILAVLIGIIFCTLLLGWMIVMQYEKQMKASADYIMEFYGDELDQNFYVISEYAIDFLMNDKNINDILKDDDALSTDEKKIEAVNAQKSLLESFRQLNHNFGEEFHFWYYNKNNGIFVQSGDGQVWEKNSFQKLFQKAAMSDEIDSSKSYEWIIFSKNNFSCAVTVYEKDNMYVGCYITLDSIIDTLDAYVEQDGGIAILNKDGDDILQSSETQDSKKTLYCQNYQMENGDFVLRFFVGNEVKRNVIIIQFAFIGVALVCAGIVIFLMQFTRKSVLIPIEYFSKCVENYKKTGTFGGDYVYEEFEDAARLLNTLEQEIGQLKIQVYEKQLEKKQVELDYAQLQIRPHFYINCLNNIYSMIQIDRKKEAQALILYVSKYLRSIFRKGIELVSIGEEMANIRNYLEIHKILYRKGIGYEEAITEDMLVYQIPPLLIQTFVENCIKHTVDLERFIAIKVEIQLCGDHQEMLKILITDNGEGFSEEYLRLIEQTEEVQSDSRFQIGVRNVRDRLRLIYGEQVSLILKNQDSGGAYVEIRLPAQKSGEKMLQGKGQ